MKTFALLITVLLFTTLALAAPTPCDTNAEARQLDYWLGEWSLGGSAHSSVTVSLDKCLLVEKWDGGKGHRGENVFGYSADDKSWYGLFADNEGRVHIFTSGKVSGGTAEFEGKSHSVNDAIVLNRVRVTRLDANKVEQTWEKSNDNGATWSQVFRGEYTRATPGGSR